VRWCDGEIATAPGWRDAYAQFVEGGWNALSCPVAHGGQGLPRLLSSLVEEMWNGANVAFALCPMLTRGAIDALELCGNSEQQATYLSKMVSGEWTGTMNPTEPQAGSDLASEDSIFKRPFSFPMALRTRHPTRASRSLEVAEFC
jgi:3-(methylthio)propanoyl-CoA dehydrogenase